jgi:dihydropteroate synthase
MQIKLRDKSLVLDKTLIMGILNVTPDSFSDGGKYRDADAAVNRALEMVAQGADMIDIGGESTRPGADKVSEQEELRRVIPVIEAFRARDAVTPVSIDTYKSGVAKRALNAGADIVNDISGGTFDKDTMKVVAGAGAAYVIMHMQGSPGNMQDSPLYSPAGVIADIKSFFLIRVAAAMEAGLKRENIILDPGIGFGKTPAHNLEILDRLGEFAAMGFPLLVGVSRKSVIGGVLNAGPDGRLFGTAAAVAVSVIKGAGIVRVHDVKEMKDAAAMADAVKHFREMEGHN